MAKISTYPIDSTVSGSDKLIGTDADNNNETKNFTVSSLGAYILGPINLQYVLDAGNTADQDIILNGSGNSIQLTGATALIEQTGITAILRQTGNSSFIQQTGTNASMSQAGSNAYFAQTGSDSLISQAGLNAEIVQSGNSAVLRQTGTSAQILQTGQNTFIAQAGNNSIIGQTGTNAQITQTGISAQIAQTGTNGFIYQSGNNANFTQGGLNPIIQQNATVGSTARIIQSGVNASIEQTGTNATIEQTGTNALFTQSTIGATTCKIRQAGNSSVIEQTGSSSIIQQTGLGNQIVQAGNSGSIVQQGTGSGIVQQAGSNYFIQSNNTSYIQPAQIKDVNLSFGSVGSVLRSLGTNNGIEWGSNNYGQFYHNATQLPAGSTVTPMRFNTTDFANGISVANDGSGNPTNITFANEGKYNLQFSAQIEKLSGGGTLNFAIWFAKNGTAITNSNTNITLANNNHLTVAAWNFLVDVTNTSDTYQIMTYNTAGSVSLPFVPAGGPIPATPSTILTVTQIA